jgi:hypothetical protein
MTPTDVSDLIGGVTALGIFAIICTTIIVVVSLGKKFGWYDK